MKTVRCTLIISQFHTRIPNRTDKILMSIDQRIHIVGFFKIRLKLFATRVKYVSKHVILYVTERRQQMKSEQFQSVTENCGCSFACSFFYFRI